MTKPFAPKAARPPRVAISEYVEIAHAFYDQGEQNFVNSVLDRVARQSRSAELAR